MKLTKALLGPIPMIISMQLLSKLLEFHFISNDISVKMGSVAIGFGIGIGTGGDSVETVLHINNVENSILIGVGIGMGIGVGQWKHTIAVYSDCSIVGTESQEL